MKRSEKVALCGMIAALCTILLFMTGMFPFSTYALPALAGILMVACSVLATQVPESGCSYFLAWFTASPSTSSTFLVRFMWNVAPMPEYVPAPRGSSCS